MQQQLFLDAAEIIERNPQKWTRGVWAPNAKGDPVSWGLPAASRCAVGWVTCLALQRGLDDTFLDVDLIDALENINDGGGRKEVVAYLTSREGICMSEKRETGVEGRLAPPSEAAPETDWNRITESAVD